MPSDLLDLLDRPGRCSGGWPHNSDGEVAGGAVADFFFVISSSRRDGARSSARPARAGAAAAGRRRHLLFSGIVVRRFGAMMELGRSGPIDDDVGFT